MSLGRAQAFIWALAFGAARGRGRDRGGEIGHLRRGEREVGRGRDETAEGGRWGWQGLRVSKEGCGMRRYW